MKNKLKKNKEKIFQALEREDKKAVMTSLEERTAMLYDLVKEKDIEQLRQSVEETEEIHRKLAKEMRQIEEELGDMKKREHVSGKYGD